MRVLLTGAAGFVGSHCLLEVLRAEHETLALDNYCNSSPIALARVKQLANRDFETATVDVRDGAALSEALGDFRPDAIIHFAGLKAVGESVEKPLDYYETNVYGTIKLLRAMEAAQCRNIVFSSTATVYGRAQYLPFDEDHPLAPENPYGQSKLMVENIMRDWATTNNTNTAIILRYFNPVGAHDSGEIGEDPFGLPNNLMPFIQQVAVGRARELTIHGDDYDTPDGTGVRDYIHVVDLARAHLAALDFAAANNGAHIFNIGSGQGSSVKEVMHGFERACGKAIPHKIGPRREGDVAISIADPKRANELLGWKARATLDDMCQSAWNFQHRNPSGYDQG